MMGKVNGFGLEGHSFRLEGRHIEIEDWGEERCGEKKERCVVRRKSGVW
jgi:hypothetical protein